MGVFSYPSNGISLQRGWTKPRPGTTVGMGGLSRCSLVIHSNCEIAFVNLQSFTRVNQEDVSASQNGGPPFGWYSKGDQKEINHVCEPLFENPAYGYERIPKASWSLQAQVEQTS